MTRLLAILALALLATACGRKGGLEVPGGAMQPVEGMGETVVLGPAEAAAPRRQAATRAARVERRTSDIIGANADAPETGDAIPEGPTAGAVVPRRRFLLDPLL